MPQDAELTEILALLNQDLAPGTPAFVRLTALVEARYPFDEPAMP